MIQLLIKDLLWVLTEKMRLYDVKNGQQNIVDSGQDDFAQIRF